MKVKIYVKRLNESEDICENFVSAIIEILLTCCNFKQ